MKGLILTYLVAFGGGVTALSRPLVGLYVYTAFSIIRPQAIFGYAGDMSGLSEIVAIPMLIGWAVQGFGDWNFRRARPIVYAMLAYFGWYCISGALAPDLSYSFQAAIDRSKELVLPFLVGITMIRTKEQVRGYAWLLVLSQGYVALEMHNYYYFRGYNLAHDSGLFGAMDNNSFAVSLVSTVVPAFVLALNTPKLWLKWLAAGAGVLTMHTIFLTYSRGGMLALVISGLVVLLLMPKRPVYLIGLLVAALIGMRLAGPEVRDRFASVFVDEEERDTSASSRLDLWADCWVLMKENPVTGVGPRRWPLVAPRFGWPMYKSAHSLWMQTGAEIGFPGLFFLLLFYALAVLTGFRLRRSGDPWGQIAGLICLTGLCGFMVSAQFVSLEGLELPFHLVLVTAASAKLVLAEAPAAVVASPAALGPPMVSAPRVPQAPDLRLR
ncbi:MAG TPA: O-antigen ligase family protein [Methylomirabilota bacterium]